MAKKSTKTKDVKNSKKIPEKIPEKTPESTKHPKQGSMLACILEIFPSEGEYSMEEVLALIREGNAYMQTKKDSSIRTVVKELVKEPEPAKASPHINRYGFLKYDKESKKYQRV